MVNLEFLWTAFMMYMMGLQQVMLFGGLANLIPMAATVVMLDN
jgi:hypothetical protein